MKKFPAAEMSRSPADIFAAAMIAPVAITKHRKPRFVIMSMERYITLTECRKTQAAVSVTDMPPELGTLLDRGLEERFDGQ